MAENSRQTSASKSQAPVGTDSTNATAHLSLDDLKQLFAMMKAHDIAELNLEQGGMKVSVTTGLAHQPPVIAPGYALPPAQHQHYTVPATPLAPSPENPPAAPAPAATPAPSAAAAANDDANEFPKAVAINSPMVGTFYRSPSPEAGPFVNVGDRIKPGQVICIVEAMKLMNELKAEIGGRIVKIVASNGNPVQYGQPLFLVEPE